MSRKQEILNILNENPIAINEIHGQLSGSISLATLKRDLSALLEQGLVKREGQGKASRYLLAQSYGLLREIDTEQYFELGLYSRKIKSYFDPYLLDLLEESGSLILTESDLEKLHQINQGFQARKAKADPTIVKRELERLAIELAWKSSQIEGNTYSILETENLIKTGVQAKGHSPDEAAMILNHKTTLNYILSNVEEFIELDLDKVIKIHNMLTQNLGINQELRSELVGISGTDYRPPGNVELIRDYLSRIIALINSVSEPLLKAILALALFAYLQAFMDGNKRTSRMIANAVLLAHNVCPLSFGSIDEHEYKKALVIFYEQNNIVYLKQLFFEQFEFATSNYFR